MLAPILSLVLQAAVAPTMCPGELYTVRIEDAGATKADAARPHRVVKVLAVRPPLLFVRIYRNRWDVRPKSVDVKTLVVGRVSDPEGFGTSAIGMDEALFIRESSPLFVARSPVTVEELERAEEQLRVNGLSNAAHGGSRHAACQAKQTVVEFERVMKTLAGAWSSQDADRALDCFTNDALYMQPPDQQLYRASNELRKLFAGLKPGTFMTFHNLAFDERTQTGFGEFSFGRAGTGQADHGVVVVTLRGGRIASWREYFVKGPESFSAFTNSEGKTWKWTGKDLR